MLGTRVGYTPPMPVEKMEPYKIRFRPTMWKKGLLIADKRGDKLSEVIRNAVRDYIRDNEHLLTDEERGE